MRMTDSMRAESSRKLAIRQEAVAAADLELQRTNRQVIPIMNGHHVCIIHLDFPIGGTGPQNSLVLEHLSDAEVDHELLGNSRFLMDTCEAMDRAVRATRPLIEHNTRTELQGKLRDLLGVEA